MCSNIEKLIDQLQLKPHPEGGYFREVIKGNSSELARAPYSSIYFLLSHDNISHFHRIDADEIWYHHKGNSLLVHMISPEGQYECISLGKEITKGDVLQYVVPKGTIFASSIANEEGYALVGCMCQPAFDFNNFKIFTQNELKQRFPHLNNIIERYAIAEI